MSSTSSPDVGEKEDLMTGGPSTPVSGVDDDGDVSGLTVVRDDVHADGGGDGGIGSSGHVCGVCGKKGGLRCGRCKSVWYCGRGCQKTDWRVHKAECGVGGRRRDVTSPSRPSSASPSSVSKSVVGSSDVGAGVGGATPSPSSPMTSDVGPESSGSVSGSLTAEGVAGGRPATPVRPLSTPSPSSPSGPSSSSTGPVGDVPSVSRTGGGGSGGAGSGSGHEPGTTSIHSPSAFTGSDTPTAPPGGPDGQPSKPVPKPHLNPLGRQLLNDFPGLLVRTKLGHGGFGDVYKAEATTDDKSMPPEVAVKIARLPDTNPTDTIGHSRGSESLRQRRHKAQQRRQAQVEEAGALKSIPPHRHVLTTLSVYDSRRWGLLIVLPLAPFGDVRSWLSSSRRSWEERLCVVMGMAFGLRNLHRLGLVHQDVKEGNVLMFEDCVARVSDFGLVRGFDNEPTVVSSGKPGSAPSSSSAGSGAGAGASSSDGAGATPPPPPPPPPSSGTASTMSMSRTMSGSVTNAGGTPCYMSPEARRGERPTVLSDMWSFGLVSWAVLHGTGHVSSDVPWAVDGGSGVRAFVESSLRGLAGPGSSGPVWLEDVVGLIGGCLSADMSSRLSSGRVVVGLEGMWRRHRGVVSVGGRGLVDGLIRGEAGRTAGKASRRAFEASRAGWLWGQKDRWGESLSLYESVVEWATGEGLAGARCRLSSLCGGVGEVDQSVEYGLEALSTPGVTRVPVWRKLAKESRSGEAFGLLLGSDVGRGDALGWSVEDVDDLLISLFENEEAGVCESVLDALVSAVDSGVLSGALGSGWPLNYASWYGHVGVVVRLLGMAGVDVNRPPTSADGVGQTALYVAAKHGHVEVVEALLGGGADVNLGDTSDEATPLHEAATGGHIEVVEVLLSAGAKVNAATTGEGVTPLFLASQNGWLDVVEALLAAKAVVDLATTDDSRSPLLQASQNGHLGVVNALLAAGADVNLARTTDGSTPLNIASQNGHLGVVNALLAAGADVDTTSTDKGTTPLFMASLNGHLELVKVLLQAPSSRS